MTGTFGPYPARVVKIHDGDTLIFDLDLGFGVRLPGQTWAGKADLSCRVFGINAPELKKRAADPDGPGEAALAYLESILLVGDICQVVSHGWDAYPRRFDGTVTLPDGSDLAKRMVDSGNAVWKTY